MTEAKNVPVRRRAPEISTADMPVGQQPNVDLTDEDYERAVEIEAVDAEQLQKDRLDALAFNEDPITIYIQPPNEKNPPLVVDCWVQGRGAEVLINGKWAVFGCLPYGIEVTTKRKYAEVLAMAKTMNITTVHDNAMVADPRNEVVKKNSPRAMFNILHDPSPKSREWASRVMATAF